MHPWILSRIERKHQLVHSLLTDVYSRIVLPFTTLVKQAMVQFQFYNEGELFCNSLKFRLIEGSERKNEDFEQLIHLQLAYFTDQYKEVFQSIIRNNELVKDIHVGLALYLATYFDLDNESSKKYLEQNATEMEHFVQLLKESRDKDAEHQRAKLVEYDAYFSACKKAEMGGSKKLLNLVTAKKLFSIPWLLCPEIV